MSILDTHVGHNVHSGQLESQHRLPWIKERLPGIQDVETREDLGELLPHAVMLLAALLALS